jgi:CDP-glucose 4,6-dehydratase
VEDGFNFGPEPADQRSVGALVEEARQHWPGAWTDATDPAAPHEAGQLALSIERARHVLGWKPRWDFARAVAKTVGWYRDVAAEADPAALVRAQIAEFEAGR